MLPLLKCRQAYSLEHNWRASARRSWARTSRKVRRPAGQGLDDPGTAPSTAPSATGMECCRRRLNGHYLRNILFTFAGQSAGAFETGRVISASGRSNNDLLVSIRYASGIEADVFGLASLC